MVSTTLLHAGLHKTASTSLQATCGANRCILAAKGYNYPSLFNSHGGLKTDNHSVALFNIFSKSRLNYHQNAGKSAASIERDICAYKQELLGGLLKKGTLILSGEDVSDLNKAEQQEMAIYLSSFSGILRTFAVIRSPYSLHCSAFAGMINSGRSLKPEQFLSQRNKIKKLKSSFRGQGNIDEIRFIPFGETIKCPRGPVKFVLEAMGVHNLDDLFLETSNEGLSNEQTRHQMFINSKNPRLIGNSVNRSWQRAPKVKGAKFLLSKRELDSIMPELLDENKWFEAHLGKNYCDTSFPTCD
ncbi:MAG: hypothetical protein CL968_04750 [Euryarchaeota archaeon]|nr:hypothetical protein [Euryarchaeota archaeon]|tara:strand:+ start:1947 stop:2846 length:900 start_codon:yes stop_codon:yes gene_type:complete